MLNIHVRLANSSIPHERKTELEGGRSSPCVTLPLPIFAVNSNDSSSWLYLWLSLER